MTFSFRHKYETTFYVFVLLTVSSLFLLYYYPWSFTHPNEIISSLNPDGIKTYFVSMSYIKNQGFSNEFTGMNYPYGLSMIYTDGMPAMAFVWKAVSKVIPAAQENFVGFYNVSILLSYLGSVVLFFLILRSFYLPRFFSAAAAFTITMLSPQMFRILGHPSFAFVAFFPLSWYLLIKFFTTQRKILITFLILVNSCFWFFVQPYYLMIIIMFYFFTWLLHFMRAKNRKGILKKIIFFSFHVLVPIIVMKVYLLAIDHHSIRPQYPTGFFDYYAKFETVFVPYYSPLTHVFQAILGFGYQEWEGWSYIGLSAVIVFFFSIFRMIRYVQRRRIKLVLKPVLPGELGNYLWASVIILLFSMCIPFKWNMEFLLEYLPLVRQFRALGRFAWVFYYVFSVYSVFILYQVFKKFLAKKLKPMAYTVVILFFVFNLLEAAWYQARVKESFKNNINPFLSKNSGDDFNQAVKQAIKSKEQYQCIVPLPYYHSGSEEFETSSSDKLMRPSMLFSYQTGIPLLSSSAARTSIDEARTLINFFAPAFTERRIEQKLNRKKFLVLYSGEELNLFEKEILRKSVWSGKTNEFEMYELSYDSVFNHSFNKGEWLKNQPICFASEDTKALKEIGFTGEVCPDLISQNFDSLPSENSFLGKGSLKGIKGNFSMLLEPGHYPLIPGKEYVVSCWYRYTKEKSNQNTLVLEEKDSDDKILRWLFGQSARQSYLGAGNWMFIQRKFRLSEDTKKFDLFFKGKDGDKNSFLVDELMIRPADKNILSIKKVNETRLLFYNNIPFDTLK